MTQLFDSGMTLKVITIPPKSGQSPTGTIVVLHGWGANAEDAAYFTSLLDIPNYQLLLPDAPIPHPFNPVGKMWYGFPETFNFTGEWAHLADLQNSRSQLLTWLNTLPTITGVPLERTILGGFSQGGAMTIEVGLELPLAGCMVLSGYHHGPIPTLTSPPKTLMVHGRMDNVVPLAAAQETRDRLLEAGVDLQYEEFVTMGHEVSNPVLDRMQTFIQQILG
ncbi:alpha/beta hydrolase [Alkalinema pantanalense]|uniref:alpha/beta hydrolase n=1 Tax=Alkalinema pantanalense TaxID=1620705 RepID=UPI003D6DE5B2